MDIYWAIILGIIQGVTEWLPISSEGITSIVMITLFGFSLKEAVFLAIWLHAGTLLAAIIFFRKILKDIFFNLAAGIGGSRHSREISRLTGFLVVSTFLTAMVGTPIVLFGLDKLDVPGRIATALIGLLLIMTGVLQLLKVKKRDLSKKIRVADALSVGTVQGFAVLPGISRSGITVSSLLLLGYDAKKALRLSFLMSIPVTLGAEIGIALIDKISFDTNALVAIISSFLAGMVTIKFFITIAEKIDFGYFCVIIGVLSCFVLFV